MKPTLKIQFLSLCVLLALLSIGTQSGFAQADPPLSFANNYFLRGDFTVAGAQGMLSNFTTINGNSYAVGTITVPDTNPGIKPSIITGNGSNAVPANAEVIAAVLYWQTVEKVGVTPGQPGSGENGFFRPVISGGPAAPGYAISGVALSSGGTNTVSWSAGGCTSGSTGKVVRTYRANVLGALPRDGTGNISPNVKYEVRLPGTSSTTPIAVGASLVLIYRILNPNIPLNSIVIYDGDYAPSNTSLIMTQTMQGFYDAAKNAVSRLAHIVGNGKSNKFETVYLNNQALPSFYPKGEPPFPGYYGSWDNTVWTFDPANKYVNLSNPVTEDSSSVTTQIVPSSNMQGCVSWGASIISTTVKNTDGDGLPDPWKKVPAAYPNYPNPGYCDAAVNEGVCTPGSASWVDLPGAVLGTTQKPHPDVFIQLDYMCSQVIGGDSCTPPTDGINYSFDPRLQIDPADRKNAVDKVVAAYAAHGITLHVNPPGTNQPNVHAAPEPYCQDDTTTNPPSLCAFPNAPGTSANLGVVTWPGGFNSIQSQLLDPDDPTNLADCATSPPAADCVPRFQTAAAPSKHYVLFGHAVGEPEWALVGGTLTNVSQSGTTVTFTASSPVGVLDSIGTDANGKNIPDPTCPNGRVTVVGAATNPDMNGTFCISKQTNPLGNSFSITVGASSMKASYTLATDPNLAVAPGFTGTASGISDVGGANSMITLGLWGNPALSGLPLGLPANPLTSPVSDGQKVSVIAGTLMHEFGHANGLAHGGPAALVAQGQQSLPSVVTNAKPNYLSSMSYSRQVDSAPDYSGQILSDLNKQTQTGALNSAATTSWYVPFPIARDPNGNPIGSAATTHSDGTPITDGAQMARVTGPASTFSWASPDINFDSNLTETLHGANDWMNLDLAQIDATGADSNSSGQRFNGGGQHFNGGGQHFNGGGQHFNGGGQRFNGGGEIDVATVNSITRPPQNLRITAEEASPRYVDLQWDSPTFGNIGAYRVYRSPDGGSTFTLIATIPGSQLSYQDNNGAGAGPACLPSGKYEYFVTAVLAGTFVGPLPQPTEGQESVPSNTVVGEPNSPYAVTGCYIVTNFLSPTSTVHGSLVPIAWTLNDDFYAINGAVTNPAASSLVTNGPRPGNCSSSGSTTILSAGAAQGSFGVYTPSGNQFTFALNTDLLCAGSYTFTLTVDSTQTQTTTAALQIQIDVNDTDTTPHITTLSIPDATVEVPYSNTLSEDGGVGAVSWSLAQGSSLPPGFMLDSSTGKLSGTPIVPPPGGGVNFTAQLYSFTVKVTDSAGNTGTQALTLRVIAPVSFKQTSYSTGKNPTVVISADFNKDGKLDLAITNTTDGTVSILLSNGDGTFTAAPSSPLAVGTNPQAVAAGDLNGDGNLDLVVANSGDNAVSVFLGNGNGTFQPGVTYSVGSYPFFVATGDFNGDGLSDLAVANQNDHSISILVGNGDGTFKPAVAYLVGTTDVANLAVGDFNKDGKLDLAATNPSSDTVSILIGNGDGSFQAPVAYATGNLGDHPIAVTAFDFNGDGNLDLAVTNLNAKTVAILLGNGGGTFQAAVPYSTTTGFFIGPSAMTTGDFNGDGKIDLAITDQDDNTASILLGNGDGTFQSPLEFPTGNFAVGVAAGDFNGDGRLDLAVASHNDNTVSVLLHLPQPPTNVATTGVTTQVPLAWTASLSTGVSGYNVYRATTSGGLYTKINASLVAGNAYTDTTVVQGTTYHYVVTAVDANGLESVNSNEVTAMP